MTVVQSYISLGKLLYYKRTLLNIYIETLSDYTLYSLASFMGHESNDGEDGKAREYRGTSVDNGNNQGISKAVVVELVVRGHGDQGAPRGT